MKRFADLETRECRWPVGDLFCGCATEQHRPYCAEHERMAHSATKHYSEGETRQIADAITGVREVNGHARGYQNFRPAVDQLNAPRGIGIGFSLEAQGTRGPR